jgi:hypothetical protein
MVLVPDPRTALWLCALLWSTAITGTAAATQKQFVEQILDDIARVTLAVYRETVIAKLQHDGTGATADYAGKKGFVPPAEKFIHQVFLGTFVSQKLAREPQLSLVLRTGSLQVLMSNSVLTQNQQARLVAALLNRMIRAISDSYTKLVVDKLDGDGSGAAFEYQSRPGFVPLPAVFVREILDALMLGQQQAGYHDFSVVLLGRWNLNHRQGLRDDFTAAAWKFLVRQQQTYLDSGKPLQHMVWRPYIETAFADDKLVLRFVDAVTASASACVSCHNHWEQQDAIKARRKRQQIEVGRQFQRYELMGVLAITIPLE